MKVISILKSEDGKWVIMETNKGITTAVTTGLSEREMISRIILITGISTSPEYIGEPL